MRKDFLVQLDQSPSLKWAIVLTSAVELAVVDAVLHASHHATIAWALTVAGLGATVALGARRRRKPAG
jgi:hypothetical protein